MNRTVIWLMYWLTYMYMTECCMKRFLICQISSVKRPRSATNEPLCRSAWSFLLIAAEQERWDVNLRDRPVHNKSSRILLARKVETQVQVRVTDSAAVLVYRLWLPYICSTGRRGNPILKASRWNVVCSFYISLHNLSLSASAAPGPGR